MTQSNDRPRIHALVLTWRDTSRTVACVTNLLGSPEVERVVVVDNETTGAMRDALAFDSDERLVLVENQTNLGFGAAVNKALEMVPRDGTTFALVINNDATIDPDSLRLLLQAGESGVGIAAPTIEDHDHLVEQSWGRVTNTLGIDRNIPPDQADYFTWACVLLSPAVVAKVGPLDENFFMYYEDVEFGLRAKRMGFTAKHVADAKATHATSSSHSEAGLAVVSYAAHGLVRLGIHERRVFFSLVRATGRALRALTRRRPAEAAAVARGVRIALSQKGPAWRSLP